MNQESPSRAKKKRLKRTRALMMYLIKLRELYHKATILKSKLNTGESLLKRFTNLPKGFGIRIHDNCCYSNLIAKK
jgi:hypothetical protein